MSWYAGPMMQILSAEAFTREHACCRYIVRSCFGGYNDSYVLSGSEECKVRLAASRSHTGTIMQLLTFQTDQRYVENMAI